MSQLSITLSRAQYNAKLAGISNAALAKLCGLQPSTLSAAFRSTVRLDSLKEAELLSTVLAIQELQDACKPFSSPTNVDDLRRVLNFIKERSISAEQVRAAMSSVFGVTE